MISAMSLPMALFVASVLFFVGLRLSAFFSGSETGFYRVSTLQLSLSKQRGDRVAQSLYYFATRPEKFVATTLVGNNVANYVTTVAIGIVTATVWQSSAGGVEIAATLLMTPVIFVFGELIPKSLYYRAPMQLLRSGSVGFLVCYYLFLPVSYPLILLSRFVAKFGVSDKRALEVVFGRARLYGVLEAGHREGLLTELQRTMAENLMQIADQSVDVTMMPSSTVRGISESASTEEALKIARQLETAHVLIHKDGNRRQWIGSLRIADMVTTGMSPRLAMKPLPVVDNRVSRLECLTRMIKEYAQFCAVHEDERVVGVVKRQALISQLFRVVRPGTSQLDSIVGSENS